MKNGWTKINKDGFFYKTNNTCSHYDLYYKGDYLKNLGNNWTLHVTPKCDQRWEWRAINSLCHVALNFFQTYSRASYARDAAIKWAQKVSLIKNQKDTDSEKYLSLTKMLKDMYRFSMESPNSQILPADHPGFVVGMQEDGITAQTAPVIGFVVYYIENHQEVTRYFYICLSDLRNLTKKEFKLIDSAKKRKLINKQTLPSIIASL